MTKGLSKQQKAILSLSVTETGPKDYYQLLHRDILIKLFGWMPARTPSYSGGGALMLG